MPLEPNSFQIFQKLQISCTGDTSASELARKNNWFVGAGICERIRIPLHPPLQRTICLGRFTGNRVMPGHIQDVLGTRKLARPTPEDALTFANQYPEVLTDLEIEYLRGTAESALVVFPNELTIEMPGRGKYNQIILGAQDGRLAIHFDYAVPWKPELVFAFASRKDED